MKISNIAVAPSPIDFSKTIVSRFEDDENSYKVMSPEIAVKEDNFKEKPLYRATFRDQFLNTYKQDT